MAEQQKHLTVNQASLYFVGASPTARIRGFYLEEHGVSGNTAVSKTVDFGSTPNAPVKYGEYAKTVWHQS